MDRLRSFALLPFWLIHVSCLLLFVKLCFGAPVPTIGEAGPEDVDTTLRLGPSSSSFPPHPRPELGYRPNLPRPNPVGTHQLPSSIFAPFHFAIPNNFRPPSRQGPYAETTVSLPPVRSSTRPIWIDLNKQDWPASASFDGPTAGAADEVQSPTAPVTPDATVASSQQPAKRPLSPLPESSKEGKTRRKSRWLVVDAQGNHITDNSQYALLRAREVAKKEALERWIHYSYNYLHQKVPSVIYQGAFFPTAATTLQRRIDDLEATKT